MKHVIVVGAGPAGLMAAEVLADAGVAVDVCDAMPSVGRKFLLAGKGGLNLTHSEPAGIFATRYGSRQAVIAPWLQDFGAAQLRDWAKGLGVDTFTGTSGRVFPADMKAAPLLRAWMHRLRCGGAAGKAGQVGVKFHMRHRWLGWEGPGAAVNYGDRGISDGNDNGHGRDPSGPLVFDTPLGRCRPRPMPWCWRWAAAVGHAWAQTAPGCRSLRHAAWRLRRCSRQIAALMCRAGGASTFPAGLQGSLSNQWRCGSMRLARLIQRRPA